MMWRLLMILLVGPDNDGDRDGYQREQRYVEQQ